ncbi:MAG: hypothetical protein AVDCRST_MAG69-1578 [uncultured Solirubrobacteraceae bacterium]|uniref:Zinc-ribbon domain-containing protein n=1 Tax=uncultured Solirubrobacteraceae bacterium TaxID=1162706 RepID=A0A6J4SCN8_9ACTN|nr:MAG: hypothetical protein AVDCRST_MAG69-1578 [uncultured Solirubrobacteraceae bacterium]
MSSLLRRIKRPRRTPAADTVDGSPAAPVPAAATPQAPVDSGAHSPLPAGENASDARPTALRRGRLRKRLRFLDRERELLLRDLGGLVYEIHRSGEPGDRERHRSLVAAKVERLAGLDHELGAGLATLGEARGEMVMREPGIGGSCPRCGEIHGSDARFCSACGFPLEVAEAPPSSVRPGPPPGDPVLPRAAVTPVAPAAAAAPQVTTPPSPTDDDAPTQVVGPSAPAAGEGAGSSRADIR